VNVDGRLGVVGIYGAAALAVSRSAARRGGAYRSLHVEELCWPCRVMPAWADAGATLLDVGWVVLSGAGAEATQAFADAARVIALDLGDLFVRGVAVVGTDGWFYWIVANFGLEPALMPVTALGGQDHNLVDVSAGTPVDAGALKVSPGHALILRGQNLHMEGKH
jgi:hypothetical protein